MVTEQDLLDAGYTNIVSESCSTVVKTDVLYQKRIEDSWGTRYFINCYSFGKEPVVFKTDFYSGTGQKVFSVELYTHDIEEAEDQLDDIWYKMSFSLTGYYERNKEVV